jgi:hypothetical protein
MKLKEYIENLQNFVKENPETAELVVVYSEDPEGNNYQPVNFYNPSKGFFTQSEYAFIHEDEFEELNEDNGEETYTVSNAVCIN